MNVYTDLRAIVLEKSTQRENMPMSCPPGRWLMLGHMDWLRVERIGSPHSSSNSACLDQLREYRRDLSVNQARTSAYSQALYVLRDFPDEQRTHIENFWSRPAAFMAITRIHSNGQSQAIFEAEVDKKLCGTESEGHRQIFPYDAYPDTHQDSRLGKQVTYLYYRSLDLSDVILVTKSDSVESLLSCIGHLFTLKTAGDIYSYYCISGIENERAVDDDRIPLISTRFAVRSAVACHNQISQLRNIFSKQDGCPTPAFFVTGTEDINIIAYNTTSRKLCEIFLQILSMDEGFRQAFYDSTTRLGIEESNLRFDLAKADKNSGGQNPDLVRACGKLLESFMELYEKDPIKNDWSRPLMELLNMLYHMSRNCVLWQICYILLNGLRGMICCVREQICGESFNVKKDKQIMQIVTGIDCLMEHIIRMEEELVHHPETRPALFDIPANLLEFYLIFSDQAVRYFQSREGGHLKCDYQMLLLPNLCEEISIHDHLNDQLSANRLLFVEMPLGLIYSPFSVVCKLVHEVAHYGGDIARNRELRFTHLANCSALLLADELGVGGSDPVFYAIRHQILSNYPEDKKLYMRDIFDSLFQTVNRIAQAETYVDEFWDIYMEDIFLAPTEKLAWLSEHVADYRRKRGERLEKKLNKVLWEIESLFKETYADLAMLTLLDLKVEDYIKILEESERTGAVSSEVSFACKIERAALVLCAIDEKKLLGLSACTSLPLARDIYTYCRIWLDEEDDLSDLPTNGGAHRYHSFEIVETILLYLKECYRMICKYDEAEENVLERQTIQHNFRLFAREQRFASLEFFQTLENYRPILINRNYPPSENR